MAAIDEKIVCTPRRLDLRLHLVRGSRGFSEMIAENEEGCGIILAHCGCRQVVRPELPKLVSR